MQEKETRRARIAELEEENATLQQRLVEVGELIAMITHDLRSPLTATLGYLELMVTDEDLERIRDYAGRVIDGVKQAEALLEDLMALAGTVTTSSIVGESEPVDCEQVYADVCRNLGPKIRESSVVVTHDTLPTVMGDGSQLTRVLLNLIDNAIKFRKEDSPRVHVSAEQQEGQWVLSVRDNGIGMDAEKSEHIFGMFEQLRKGEYPGTGVGLAICKMFVQAHGGEIWVESEVGKGSTFYFTIPTQEDVKAGG